VTTEVDSSLAENTRRVGQDRTDLGVDPSLNHTFTLVFVRPAR